MDAALYYDGRFLDHETGAGHPERPERLRAVMAALAEAGLRERMAQPEFTAAATAQLQGIHDPLYIEQVEGAFADGVRRLDPDTSISAGSYDAARLAAGAAVAAADAVMAGQVRRAFCAVRPPGHHAEHDRAMGFCLFNSIAIAADHLTREHGLERVAIVDFDVHHGNGTQHSFESRADVLFVSVHQDPRTIFPGSGFAEERGQGEGEGFTLNVPMEPGAGDADYERVFEEKVLPRVREHEPEVLLVSAGFDAAAEDPLGSIELSAEGFGWMTRQLAEVAETFAEGRMISLLEGGYDLGALGRCAAAHVEAML